MNSRFTLSEGKLRSVPLTTHWVLTVFLTVCCLPFFSIVAAAQSVTPISGHTQIRTSAATQPVRVTFHSVGTPSSVRVLTNGSPGLDFTSAGDDCVSSSVFAPGQTCTVKVQFTPTTPGERRGAVVVLDGSNRVLATQGLLANASGPLAVFTPGTITTVAGNASTFLFAGDGGLATRASLFLPFGMALDGAGDLYIADTYNDRIRRVDASTGIINTVAGNGVTGYSGDGGPALSASFNHPSSVQVDGAGNVYIADSGNDVIRVLNSATGTVSTVAGTGTGGYSGNGGQATAATLQTPNGMAFDASGNLYLADTGNNVVRMINATSGVISTVAGNGTAGFSGDGGSATRAALHGPWGIAVSSAGELFIADQSNNRIRKVSTSGVITTIAGASAAAFQGDGGLATAARLNTPAAVLLDNVGNLYISDSGNNRVRKINASSGIISTIAGGHSSSDNNPATSASLSGPYALAMDGMGDLFLADVLHNRIRKVSSNQAILIYATQRVNSVSAAQNEIIENDGTAPLSLTSLTAVSNAVIDPATTCSLNAVIAPGAQCALAAAFAPSAVGNPATGSITIDSNATNANNNLTLQGVVESTYDSTVLLSANPNPVILGQPVQFSIQVISSGSIIATGKVTLLDGPTTIATMQLTNGVASVSLSNVAIGQHTITASYAGDVNNAAAVSPDLIEVVEPVPVNAGTTTNLTSSANPSSVGSVVTLTASVASIANPQGVPTGAVTFKDGATVLGVGTLSGGSASLNVSTLALGTHSLTAVYGGNSSYTTSSSAVLTQVVVSSVDQGFSFDVTPTTVSLQSGSKTTLQVTLSVAETFTGPISFGCGGLPSAATCTFSQDQIAGQAGMKKAITVVLDTGNPLGAGATARNETVKRGGSNVLLCGFPAVLLASLLLGRRYRGAIPFRLGAFIAVLGTLAIVSGCGSSYNVTTTPAGTYDVQVFASSTTKSASYTVPVRLTVTK